MVEKHAIPCLFPCPLLNAFGKLLFFSFEEERENQHLLPFPSVLVWYMFELVTCTNITYDIGKKYSGRG
jgi:hypothetical protein